MGPIDWNSVWAALGGMSAGVSIGAALINWISKCVAKKISEAIDLKLDPIIDTVADLKRSVEGMKQTQDALILKVATLETDFNRHARRRSRRRDSQWNEGNPPRMGSGN